MTDENAGNDIPWRQTFPHPDWNVPGDAVVWIDVTSFDTAWHATDQWVGPSGKIGAQDDRYRRVGEWIEAGNIVNMCQNAVDEDGVSFTNRRHRFAWLRDRGVRAMSIQVSLHDATESDTRFGTSPRLSRLPLLGRAVG